MFSNLFEIHLVQNYDIAYVILNLINLNRITGQILFIEIQYLQFKT